MEMEIRDWNRIKHAVANLDGKASSFASAAWAFLGIFAAGVFQIITLASSAITASTWVWAATWAFTATGLVAAIICGVAHFVTRSQRGKESAQIVQEMNDLLPESLNYP